MNRLVTSCKNIYFGNVNQIRFLLNPLIRRCNLLSFEEKLLDKEKRCFVFHRSLHRSCISLQDDNFEMTSHELDKILHKDNLSLIDVRGYDEIELSGKIPGAVNIPMDEIEFAFNLSEDIFEKRYGFIKPPDDGENVIFYCYAGIRSLRSLTIAKNIGLERAKHLSGGYMAWQEHEQIKK